MKGYDTITELYNGRLHPAEARFRGESDLAFLEDAHTEAEKWLKEHLGASERQRLDELFAIQRAIVSFCSLENFRRGFQLGVALMIDAVSFSSEMMYDR